MENVPQIVMRETQRLIDTLSRDDLLIPSVCSNELINNVNSIIDAANVNVENGSRKLKYLTDMPTYAIPDFIVARGDVALIAPQDKGSEEGEDDAENPEPVKLPIAIYQTEGLNKGIWQISNDAYGSLGDLVAQYKPNATRTDKNEVYTSLKGKLPIKYKCGVQHLAPVGNCIVDTLNKEIIPFSPDYVFTSKIRTHLNLNATNPHIQMPDGSDWNVEDWMQSLAPDDPELVECLWQVIRATMLPNMPNHKLVIMLSSKGNNGKGTICALIRTILGTSRTANISIADFSKDFGIATLPSAMCVLCDENDTNRLSERNSTLKAVVTGDRITVNVKHVTQYDYTWTGTVIQCCNAVPRVSDKTGSFQRRLLLLKMPSCFTGREIKAIKQDYIHRREVREYVLYKALMLMPYRDNILIPESAKDMLDEYISMSNSVVAFCSEMLSEFVWDLLPATDLLYAVYKEWYHEAHPNGFPVGKQEFLQELKEYVEEHDCGFEWTDSTRSKGRMHWYEPLIHKYNVKTFGNYYCTSQYYSTYMNSYTKEKYSGLKRKIPSANNFAVDSQTDDDTTDTGTANTQ